MLFIPHPGNISAGDVTLPAAAAAASPASLMVGYEPQPVPLWPNATQVKKNFLYIVFQSIRLL